MAKREKPCTKEEFDNPNLISDSYEHVFIDGIEMTAANIWEYPDREALVEKLTDYFYKEGFVPYIDLDDKSTEKELLKLKAEDQNSVVDSTTGAIKNSSRICLDVCRTFCRKSFYNVKVNGLPSIADVYKDKELLRKILKNRMGWYTSTETIKKKGKNIVGLHPYLFDISHKMIVQGAHSSMTSGNVSNFRPLIAKYLISKYCSGNVILDLSAGWGARFLGAWSLGKEYYGIDPMTAEEIEAIRQFIINRRNLCNEGTIKSKLICGCSEDNLSYNDILAADYVIVCPPYFKLEEYKCEKNSTDCYQDYQSWLEQYWHKTVNNAYSKMRNGAKFSLIMIQEWEKKHLLDDMSKICQNAGLVKIDELAYKTTRSHLTDKRNTGNTNKNTERIVTFQKN